MEKVSSIEIQLGEVKDFVVANVNCQLENPLSSARLYMQGSAGIGKSDIMRQICKEQGWGLVVKYLSNMAFEQLTGLPVTPKQGETASWSKPDLLNFDLMENVPENYKVGETPTILVLDDFHLAEKQYQKYMFQLFTYNSLQGYKLPKNTAIILAGNRTEDKAGAATILSPVCNRIQFVSVKASATDWLNNYAMKVGIRQDICTFIAEKGDIFLNTEPIENGAFATPRAWTYLNNQMNSFEKLYKDMPIDKLRTIANGYLGEEVTSEFIMYRELFSKWNFAEMRKESWNTVRSRIKKEAESNPTAVYAVINAGLSHLIDTFKKENSNIETETMKEVSEFVYKVLCFLLVMKTKKGTTARPLVVAGTNYLYRWQKAQNGDKSIASKNSLVTLLLQTMKQERNCDLVFYDVMAEIFNLPLSENDKKKIENAKNAVTEDDVK